MTVTRWAGFGLVVCGVLLVCNCRNAALAGFASEAIWLFLIRLGR